MHQAPHTLLASLLIVLGVSLLVAASDLSITASESDDPTTPPSIATIRELSELTVLEVEASEVVETSVGGYTGATSLIAIVNGTVTYGVDLNGASYLRTDRRQQHLVIALPPPEIIRVASNPHKSRVLSCARSGLWQLAPGPAREDDAFLSAMALGHDRLVEAAPSADLLARAKRHAEAVLARFVSELGWTIEVHWDT